MRILFFPEKAVSSAFPFPTSPFKAIHFPFPFVSYPCPTRKLVLSLSPFFCSDREREKKVPLDCSPMEDLSIKQPPFHLEKGAKGKQVERTRSGTILLYVGEATCSLLCRKHLWLLIDGLGEGIRANRTSCSMSTLRQNIPVKNKRAIEHAFSTFFTLGRRRSDFGHFPFLEGTVHSPSAGPQILTRLKANYRPLDFSSS